MPLEPQVLIITGVTGGLGGEICKQALISGYQVIAVGRSSVKLSELMKSLDVQGLGKFLFLECCDFTNLDEIAFLCRRLEKVKVSGILNIAGVRLGESNLTVNGYEVHLQINLIAPFILNKFFSLRNPQIKIANFGSSAGLRSTCRNSNEFFAIEKFKSFDGPYARSKLGLAIVSRKSAELYPKAKSLTFDPGNIRTQMTTGDSFPRIFRLVAFLAFKSPKNYARKFMNFYVARFEEVPSGSYLRKFKKKKLPGYFDQIDDGQIVNKLEDIHSRLFATHKE